jgi:hypothetical protein
MQHKGADNIIYSFCDVGPLCGGGRVKEGCVIGDGKISLAMMHLTDGKVVGTKVKSISLLRQRRLNFK